MSDKIVKGLKNGQTGPGSRRPCATSRRPAAQLRGPAPTLLSLALAGLLGIGALRARAEEVSPPPEAQRLQTRLETLVAEAKLGRARVGAAVVELHGGQRLAALRAEEPFNLASLVKLLTSAAALTLLGPEYRVTTVLMGGELRGDELTGDLWLEGHGDPDLQEGDLWDLVQTLYDRGVRRVQGGLRLDESRFDAILDPPLFATRKTDLWYRARVGALSLCRNVLTVLVRGGEATGDPPRLVLLPRSSFFEGNNQAATVGPRERAFLRFSMSERDGAARVTVKGRIRPGKTRRLARLRVTDPGLVTGHALLDLLRVRGIQVKDPTVRRGRRPESAQVLAWHASRPLSQLVQAMNKRSDNFMAEQLLKLLGAETQAMPGTSEAGLRAVTQVLATFGVKPGTYTLKNGSGLYEASALTPTQLTAVIRGAANDFKVGPDFVASLPLAGADGTLRYRMRGTGAERYVRAKTGTLSGVISLAGLAGASKRGPLVFAVVINDLDPELTAAGRRLADQIAGALVDFSER